MTPEQKELARHALGLPNKTRTSYRNRFIAGETHRDFDNWQLMVADGNAERHRPVSILRDSYCFTLTKQGATLALLDGEKLDKEDFQ